MLAMEITKYEYVDVCVFPADRHTHSRGCLKKLGFVIGVHRVC